jgi:anion-transporting  ArsA/GET3 family ATPase
MTEDFSIRARQVQEMLTASTTAFLLVTSAQTEPIEEAIWFRRTLDEGGLPFAGVVVNRVHHDMLGQAEPDDVEATLAGELGPGLAARVAENLHDYHVLARRDADNVTRLEAELDGRPLLLVPQLDDDVHDVEGLLRMHRYLFASDLEREQLIADVVA